MASPMAVSELLHRFNQGALLYYPRLTPVLRYVEAHISKPISLDEAAKVAGLESKYFSAFFRSKVGTSFTEWIRLLRVKRAAELFQVRDESITFERVFKRCTGVTPKAYRATIRPESRWMSRLPGGKPPSARVVPRGSRRRLP